MFRPGDITATIKHAAQYTMAAVFDNYHPCIINYIFNVLLGSWQPNCLPGNTWYLVLYTDFYSPVSCSINKSFLCVCSLTYAGQQNKIKWLSHSFAVFPFSRLNDFKMLLSFLFVEIHINGI